MKSNITSERVRSGLTQNQLAEQLSVSSSTVYRWETGGALPGGDILVKMRKLFGCTTDYLLGLSDERKAS